MIGTSGTSAIGRGLSALVLASFLLSFAPPSAGALSPDPMDCGQHHTLPQGSAIEPAPESGGGDCGPMDACGIMPGCGAAAPAIVAPGAVVLVIPAGVASEPQAVVSLHGLPALGPPTPPPNS